MNKRLVIHLSESFFQPIIRFVYMFGILTTLTFLTSCFSENIAPTKELFPISIDKTLTPNYHKVKSGQTIYSIARQYGLDYRVLAQLNGIGRNFLIYVDQLLKIPSYYQKKSPIFKVSKKKNNAHNEQKPSAELISSNKKTPTSLKNSLLKFPQQPTILTKQTFRSEKKSFIAQITTKKRSSSTNIRWSWPIDGKILTKFSINNGLHKGIDIQVKKGDSVRAAAVGQVIYVGRGFRGYGKLIIIKHNDTYLSAYAYNNRIYVKEKETVKAGQHIADIGFGSGSPPEVMRLRFEIRCNGQPIDPLILLPKRRT